MVIAPIRDILISGSGRRNGAFAQLPRSGGCVPGLSAYYIDSIHVSLTPGG